MGAPISTRSPSSLTEMLTGAKHLQHEAVEGIHTLDAIEVAAEVPLRKDIPLHVNAALRRALSAGAAHRFATTTDFAEALAGRGPKAAPGLPTNRTEFRLIRRRRIAGVVGALLAILACITIADPKLRGMVARTWSNVDEYLPGSSHRPVGVYIDPVSAPGSPPVGQPMVARAHEGTQSAPGTPRLHPSTRSPGLDLELNFGQSGAAVTQQLTGGSLDVALSVGITDPIRAIEKGAPLALVRIVGNAAPYVLIGKPGLKSITDLKGKTISTGADNDITTVYFERMMAANGLKKGDYDHASGGRRGGALCRAQGRRRRRRDGAAAAQLPGRRPRASPRLAMPRTT